MPCKDCDNMDYDWTVMKEVICKALWKLGGFVDGNTDSWEAGGDIRIAQ